MAQEHTAGPDNGIQVKVWIRKELIEWVDGEAERRERSRGFLINEAIGQRMQRIEKDRERARKRRGTA